MMLSNDEIEALYITIREKLRERRCIICGSETRDRRSLPDFFVCTLKICKKKFSIFTETIFSKTHLSHILDLKILNMWSVGANPLLISKILLIKPKQVSIVLNALRKRDFLAKYLLSMPKLGGSSIIVEVDESKFGRRKYNRGHLVEGVWVLGIVERTESRLLY